MVQRHPFPGLGVRILGEVTATAAETMRLADYIFIHELRRPNDRPPGDAIRGAPASARPGSRRSRQESPMLRSSPRLVPMLEAKQSSASVDSRRYCDNRIWRAAELTCG